MNANPVANVVLVHGGFVDGSGWRPVYDLLKQDGYQVAVVQNPTLSLEGDAAATRLIIDAQDDPVVLVGHSYGGAVITEAGTDQNVAALVYICAFAPDKDESVNTLLAGFPPDARSRRSCRPGAASCSWTATSSTPRSRATCPTT
jgi:pimeloyl-ACP methyl ester carboxylesterase